MKSSRFELKLEPALMAWARAYCKEHNLTIAHLVRQLLLAHKRKDEEDQNARVDAEQI